MLELAIAGDARFDVDDRELRRDGPTYTVRHARRVPRASAAPDTPLVFLCGTDAFAHVETWHRWESLFDLAHFAVAMRADDPEWQSKGPGAFPKALWPRVTLSLKDVLAAPAGRIMTFAMTPLAISSTAIRDLVQARRLHPLPHPRPRGRLHPPAPALRNPRVTRQLTTLAKKKLVVAALEDIKARDILAIDVRKITSMFDWIVVASAESARQTKALARHVRDKLKEAGCAIVGTEGEESGEWVLVDAGDIVAHVMQPAVRAYYNLEELWGEGKFDRPVNPTSLGAERLAHASEEAEPTLPHVDAEGARRRQGAHGRQAARADGRDRVRRRAKARRKAAAGGAARPSPGAASRPPECASRSSASATRCPPGSRTGFGEYVKRLPPEIRVELVELKPEERTSGKTVDKAKALEGERILAAIPEGATLFALDEKGRSRHHAGALRDARRLDARRARTRRS